MAAVGNNDHHVLGQEGQIRKTSDKHNSDIAERMSNQESSAVRRLNDMDKGTVRGVTRKRNADNSSLKCRKKGTSGIHDIFEGRFKQLIDFKDKFGHCHVPCKYPVGPSLGKWCSDTRSACRYKNIQQGQTLKENLTQDQNRVSERDWFQMGTCE